MNSFADKVQENKQQTASQTVIQKEYNATPSLPFIDNHPTTVAQRQLQEIANNSQQVKQAMQFQTMMNANSSLPIQKKDKEEEELIQGKFEPALQTEKPNNTGLPNQLKSGIENLSGMSLDHVKVHYNSEKPAQLQAHAYAQGSDIHVAPGQEQHLPHEAWHVVQQAQRRVQPTMQLKENVLVNDDAGLEKEADLMGAKALNSNADPAQLKLTNIQEFPARNVTQMQWIYPITGNERETVSATNTLADNGDFIHAFSMLVTLSPNHAIAFHNIKPSLKDPAYEDKNNAIENILFETFDSADGFSFDVIIEKIRSNEIFNEAATPEEVEPVEDPDEEMKELIRLFSELSIREKFRSDVDEGKEEHEVYQKDGEVIVKSNPTPLTTIILNANWEGYPISPALITKLTALQATAQTALYKIAGKKPLGITGARTQANMNAFRVVLKNIAGIFANLGGATHKASLMKQTVLLGTNSGGDSPPVEGSLIKANPLSILSATSGSKPKDGRLMKSIRAAAGPQSKSYVQMHLLNDLVFGPGQLWNLTPGPKQSNSTMESIIEDPLKRAILDKGLTINFEAEVNYNQDPMSATQKQIDQAPNDYRFTFIKFKAEELEYDPTNKIWIRAAVQDPDVAAINGKKVNWDYGSLKPLVAKPRILDNATTISDLITAKIQPAAAARIYAYVQANPGVSFSGAGKQKKLANAVKKWDGGTTIPNISSWKATSVLWS